MISARKANITASGKQVDAGSLTPQQEFTVSFEWALDTTAYCPSCISQAYILITATNVPSQCVWSGSGAYDVRLPDLATATFNAPAVPGSYNIALGHGWDTECKTTPPGRNNTMRDGWALPFATITVRPNSCATATCNVCKDCCADFIPDGAQCDKCVSEKCA